MDSIQLTATRDTPGVILDKANNIFELSGKSVPEDAYSVYKPILEWLNEYAKSPNLKTKFVLKFKYFNTASSKFILDVLFKLAEMHNNGTEILISWQYNEKNEDMRAAGKEYEILTELPFEHVPLII